MSRVDGNALAGVLSELLSVDATTLRVICAECDANLAIAEAYVELDDSGAVVCCRHCTHTLMTVLHGDSGVRLRIVGIAEIASP